MHFIGQWIPGDLQNAGENASDSSAYDHRENHEAIIIYIYSIDLNVVGFCDKCQSLSIPL